MANFDEIAHLFAADIAEQAEEAAERRNVKFRPRIDPFDLDNTTFIRLFRLSKILTLRLINLLTDNIVCGSRKSALDVKTKVFIFTIALGTQNNKYFVGINSVTLFCEWKLSNGYSLQYFCSCKSILCIKSHTRCYFCFK